MLCIHTGERSEISTSEESLEIELINSILTKNSRQRRDSTKEKEFRNKNRGYINKVCLIESGAISADESLQLSLVIKNCPVHPGGRERANVFLCVYAQSLQTLCGPLDCSPRGSSLHGISQARVLEWVAISSSRGSFLPKNQT